MLNRRQFCLGTMAAVLPAVVTESARREPWEKAAYRKPAQSRVAVLEARSYDMPLEDILCRGLQLFRLPLHGKTVVLKPNLVEYDPAGSINTHPVVIAAAIEAFKRLGAREVIVAEGPGIAGIMNTS